MSKKKVIKKVSVKKSEDEYFDKKMVNEALEHLRKARRHLLIIPNYVEYGFSKYSSAQVDMIEAQILAVIKHHKRFDGE